MRRSLTALMIVVGILGAACSSAAAPTILCGIPTACGPPVPSPVGATINANGTVSKASAQATVSGTVSCGVPETVTLTGTLSEAVKHGTASAPFSASVPCGWSGGIWSATVSSTSGEPFAGSTGQVMLIGTASDAFPGQQATTTASGSVKLSLGR